MKRHFLVTISNDVNILYGVRFVCSFFQQLSEHQLTLFHVCLREGSKMSQSLGQMWEGNGEENEIEPEAKARRSIARARKMLEERQMPAEHVQIRTCAERYGKVKDILMEAAGGHYDAIILGRRASYSLQWMFERPGDETALAAFRDSNCTTPLWICPEPKPGARNVLVCVDGSENSSRAVDHAGFILAGEPEHGITLFHAGAGSSGSVAEMFAKAETILHNHGIGADRISRNTGWGLTVAGSILSEIARGGYAAAAVGMYGERQAAVKNISLSGSTTAKLISKIDKTALWCCP